VEHRLALRNPHHRPAPAPTDPVGRGIELYNQDKADLSILHLERFLQLAPDAPEALRSRRF